MLYKDFFNEEVLLLNRTADGVAKEQNNLLQLLNLLFARYLNGLEYKYTVT